MRSPFPGMDPYLERHWLDVHHSLCTYARDALQPQLRPALLARVEERVVVESEDEFYRALYPDVKVVARRGAPPGAPQGSSVAVLEEPLVIRAEAEPRTEGFIQIIDPASGGKLVTVIEILSTSNKVAGEGQTLYIKKQKELREARVSLVEIDLLRAGDWVVQVPRALVRESHLKPYRICVHRGYKESEYELYRAPIEHPLPSIRIPLREGDRDAVLPLQELIDQTYANGAYDSIDYQKPPDPALDPETAAWADGMLRSAGKR